jgi:hypothetical protein
MQRRVMLQRTSILFWQLLAATIAVDAVVCYWAWESSLESVEQVYFGLACGQVSVAAIGAFFAAKRNPWRWLLPFAAVAAATTVTTWIAYEPIESIKVLAATYVALWLMQSLGVLAGLWALEHSRLGDWWRSAAQKKQIRFGTKHLLIAMTVLAVLLVACRLAEINDVWFVVVAWAANNVAIAMVAAVCHCLPWHFFLRWAAYAAMVVALTYALVFLADGGEAAGINAYQALILFLWLTIAGIGPARPHEIYVDSAASPPLESST